MKDIYVATVARVSLVVSDVMCCLDLISVCCIRLGYCIVLTFPCMCLYDVIYFPLLPCSFTDCSNPYSRDLSGVQEKKGRGEAKVFLRENEGKQKKYSPGKLVWFRVRI